MNHTILSLFSRDIPPDPVNNVSTCTQLELHVHVCNSTCIHMYCTTKQTGPSNIGGNYIVWYGDIVAQDGYPLQNEGENSRRDEGSSGVDRDHGGLIKMCILKAYTLLIVLLCVTC